MTRDDVRRRAAPPPPRALQSTTQCAPRATNPACPCRWQAAQAYRGVRRVSLAATCEQQREGVGEGGLPGCWAPAGPVSQLLHAQGDARGLQARPRARTLTPGRMSL